MPQEEIYGVDQFRNLVNSDRLCVVCFSAVWCGPCRTIQPDLEKLTYQFPDALFLKVDADNNSDIVQKCNISALPTFMLVRGGKQLGYLIGTDMNELKAKIRSATNAAAATA